MPTMTVMSATMRKLHRDQISRRRAALASTGGVAAKKPSQPEPAPPAPRHADDSLRSRMTAASSTCSASRGADLLAAEPAAEVKSKCIGSFGKGAQVRVRTRVGKLRTGQALVLWLRAVVVSAADEDGYLRVAYTTYSDGKLPRVARVPPSDIKLHVPPPPAEAAHGAAAPSGSSVVTSELSARPSSLQQGRNKAAPRPTVAGKKLPKKLEKEMHSWCKAIARYL